MSADRLSPARPAPMRAGAGIAGVAATSALLALGQLWAARQLSVLDPAQEWYVAGNDLWPFQLFLMAWYAASAAVVGLALIWPMVPGHQRWQVRIAATLAAVAGASACLPLVRAWSAAAQGVTDPAGEATRLVLVGLLAAAAAAAVSTALPAVRRGLVGWVGWTWLTSAAAISVETSAGPFGLLPTLEAGGAVSTWLSVLTPLTVITVLGAWAARQGERLPVLGAVSGPLLQALVATGLVAFNGTWGDHYDPGMELVGSILFALLGAALATGAVAWVRGRTRRADRAAALAQPGPETRTGTALLQVAGYLLVAAGLLQPGGTIGVGSAVLVASGVLAIAVGVVAGRRRSLGRLAGVAMASGAWVAASLLTRWWQGELTLYLLPISALEVPIVVLVALLGSRSVRAAAACGLAAVALRIVWITLALGYAGMEHQLPDGLPSMVLALAAAILLLVPLLDHRLRQGSALSGPRLRG